MADPQPNDPQSIRGRVIAATVRAAIEQVDDPELRAKLDPAGHTIGRHIGAATFPCAL